MTHRSEGEDLEVYVCDSKRRPCVDEGVSFFMPGAAPQHGRTNDQGIVHFVAPGIGTATIAIAGFASQHVLGSARRIVIPK